MYRKFALIQLYRNKYLTSSRIPIKWNIHEQPRNLSHRHRLCFHSLFFQFFTFIASHDDDLVETNFSIFLTLIFYSFFMRSLKIIRNHQKISLKSSKPSVENNENYCHEFTPQIPINTQHWFFGKRWNIFKQNQNCRIIKEQLKNFGTRKMKFGIFAFDNKQKHHFICEISWIFMLFSFIFLVVYVASPMHA